MVCFVFAYRDYSLLGVEVTSLVSRDIHKSYGMDSIPNSSYVLRKFERPVVLMSELIGSKRGGLFLKVENDVIELTVNNETMLLEIDSDTPLLWVIREKIGLMGTKFGCGIAQCGACTVHLDGQPIRSCSTPVRAAIGRSVTTIEGLSPEDFNSVQQAWIEEQVPQCGYCQSGQIMSAVALLSGNDDPSDEDINSAMRGNVCRCGTYPRIRKAIKRPAKIRDTVVKHYVPVSRDVKEVHHG